MDLQVLGWFVLVLIGLKLIVSSYLGDDEMGDVNFIAEQIGYRLLGILQRSVRISN